MQDYRRVRRRIISYITADVWRFSLDDLPRKKSFLYKVLRIILLAMRGFRQDNCKLRATALTFFTLLSIVPVLAMAFSIAKGLGFEASLQQRFLDEFAAHEVVVQKVISFAHSMLESTKGGTLAGIGVVVLLWTVLSVIGHLEDALNQIWEVKDRRGLGQKITDYVVLTLICPLFVIFSLSANVYVTTQLTLITSKVKVLEMVSPFIFFSVKFLPYFLIWTLFAFIYLSLPRTKVNLTSGILAGIVAGTIYVLAQWIFILSQVKLSRYNAIYGSFAVLPLLLMWLHLSWLIVLFGAEISFAHQNVATYEFEPDFQKISHHMKKLLFLNTAHFFVRHQQNNDAPVTAAQISHILEIPIRLMNLILSELAQCQIITACADPQNKTPVFQLRGDANRLSVSFLINSMEKQGRESLPVARTASLESLNRSLATFGELIEQSPDNRLLKDI